MTLYELVFILLFLGSAISLLISAFLWRGVSFRKTQLRLVSVWAVYLVILAIADSLRSQKVFKVGEDECFDEMCFAVHDEQTSSTQAAGRLDRSESKRYFIAVKMASHSRGRAQAEGGLRGRLYDNGRYINVSEGGQYAYDAQHLENVRLTQKISPGESILSVLVFDVPKDMLHPELTLDHGLTPAYFVIGDSPLFHKPDIHQLPPTP